MTIKEWKEMLSKYPDDWKVCVEADCRMFTYQPPAELHVDEADKEITLRYEGWY